MPQSFNVRNIPYINQDDVRYYEAFLDLINKITEQQAQIESLKSRVEALGG